MNEGGKDEWERGRGKRKGREESKDCDLLFPVVAHLSGSSLILGGKFQRMVVWLTCLKSFERQSTWSPGVSH